MIAKLMTQILTSPIRSQGLNFLATLIFNLILKFLELFKGFRLMLHQIDIAISTQIINESYEVLESSSGRRAHWSAHISMYEFQQVRCSLGKTYEWYLGHLA
jgi:hypothetical protein